MCEGQFFTFEMSRKFFFNLKEIDGVSINHYNYVLNLELVSN